MLLPIHDIRLYIHIVASCTLLTVSSAYNSNRYVVVNVFVVM